MRFSFVFSLLAAAATHSLAQTPEEEAFFPGPSTISTPSPPPPTFTHSRRAAAVLAARGGGYGGVRTEADAVNLNLETWAEDTTRACAAMINGTTQANNPSGISLCYNIPLLITATGVFAADLRLFNVSPPTGDWADVPLQNYSVNLVYAGAVITPPRNLSLPEITASDRGMNGFNLSKLVDYEYIGKLDNDVVAQSPPECVPPPSPPSSVYFLFVKKRTLANTGRLQRLTKINPNATNLLTRHNSRRQTPQHHRIQRQSHLHHRRIRQLDRREPDRASSRIERNPLQAARHPHLYHPHRPLLLLGVPRARW